MDRSAIVKVLEALGATKIKVQGNSVKCCCPFAGTRHTGGTDSNPSFTMEINPSGPSKFFCFACKSSGKKSISLLYYIGSKRPDLWAFIMEQEGGSLPERAKKLRSYDDQRRSKLPQRQDSTWVVHDYERAFTLSEYDEILSVTDHPYATGRGISPEQADRWKIGFNRERHRLFISIFDENQRMVGFSERAIYKDQHPKYRHAKNMARDKYLYGEQFIDRKMRLGFITEGFMDVLALERHGWKNCLGTMGTKPSKPHVEKLRKWFDCVVIFPHNDAKPPVKEDGTQSIPPGRQMALDYKNALLDVGVKVYIAPVFDGRKDPGEWISAEHDAMRHKLRKLLDEYEPPGESGEVGPTLEAEGSDQVAGADL